MIVRITYSGARTPFSCFGLFGLNSWGERVFFLDSTHPGGKITFPEEGVVECAIHDLRLGEGSYTLMLDYASCTGENISYKILDCVPAAIKFEVDLGGFVQGTGCSSAQGAPHQTFWEVVE